MLNLRQYFSRSSQQEKLAADSDTQAAPDLEATLRDTVSGSSTAASTTSSLYGQSTFSTSTLPDDLPVPPVGNTAIKWDMVAKGPTQPRDCNFPRREFSNGNLSFNPRWYDIKEAKGWLEYSVKVIGCTVLHAVYLKMN